MTTPFALGMAAQFEAALAAFGETVRYTPLGRTAPGELQGVWERPGVLVEGFGEAGVRDGRPTLSIRQADVPHCRVGDALLRAGRTYRVADIDPDSEGAALLTLELVDTGVT